MTLRRARGPGLTLVIDDGQPVPAPPARRNQAGIAKQADGSYRVRVSVGPRSHTLTAHRRFPPHTALRLMRDWQVGARARLLDRLPQAARGDTLAADVQDYLRTVPAASRANVDILLTHWTDALGARPTLSLTRQDVQRQLATWRTAAAASTVNHRLSALSMFYRRRYPDHESPCRDVGRYQEPPGAVPTWTLTEVRTVLDGLPASRAAAHLRVFAETGIPPIRLTRVRPEHLRLDATPPTVYLEGRRKGRGTPGRVYPLTQAAVAAWRTFAEAGAWGAISTVTLATVWRRGCERAGRVPCRVYDLRHIIGAEMYRRCGDLRAVAELLDVSVETALRYTRGAVPEAVSKVITAMDPTVASGRPSGHTKKQA